MAEKKLEVWMRGAVPGVDAYLQPVVHSLLQVKEEIEALAPTLTNEMLWLRPGGAGSLAFHLDHIAGATDRLITYSRGEQLSAEQFAFLKGEGGDTTRTVDAVITATLAALDRGIEQITATPPASLLEPRKVGRAGHPSTTLGLLFHAAEHATRHIGQATTTAKVVAD